MARKKKKRVSDERPGSTKGKGPLSETHAQRIKRLKKAGYTDVAAPRGTERKTKRGLRERARKEAYRLIAKQEGITIKEARKRFKKSLVEFIYENPARTAYRKFYKVDEGKFLEFEKGKPPRMEYTTGPVRSSGYVQRVMSLKKYWNTVHLLEETWGITSKQARAYMKKTQKQFGKKAGYEVIYTDLGLYEEAYPGRR